MRQSSRLNSQSMTRLKDSVQQMGLSDGAYDKILHVSRRIADLGECPTIEACHLQEAVNYRVLVRQMWTSMVAATRSLSARTARVWLCRLRTQPQQLLRRLVAQQSAALNALTRPLCLIDDSGSKLNTTRECLLTYFIECGRWS